MGSSLRSEHHNCQLGKSTCTMWAFLLLGVLGSAAAKTIFPVPEPYRWDETFTVEFPQMDDEHRGLFNAILKEITDEAKNWLAQHIKNTDFAYRGKLHLRRHYVVPEPYIWEAS